MDKRSTPNSTATAIALLVTLGSAMVSASTFIVTTTADTGAGSLRQAITDANATAGLDTIAFNIAEGECSLAGVCTISLASLLPAVTEAVDIDGTTQPRYGSAPGNVCAGESQPSYMRVLIEQTGDPAIEINGTAEPSSIRGLAFGGPGVGIYVSTNARTFVQCNHFGLNGEGTSGTSISDGVCVACFGTGGLAMIGTDGDGVDDLAERNVFGNASRGVNINAGNPAQPNRVAGNFFGLAADGMTPISISRGVFMRQNPSTLIGSELDGISDELEANVFANAFTAGIQVVLDTGQTSAIVGNRLGVNAAGGPAANVTGIDSFGGSLEVRSNEIAMNTTGISLTDGFSGNLVMLSATSTDNCVSGNGTGLSHNGTEPTLFAENNFWGSADGPSGAGPGSGDSIVVTSTGTVDFDPWQTECSASTLLFADGFESGDVVAWQ